MVGPRLFISPKTTKTHPVHGNDKLADLRLELEQKERLYQTIHSSRKYSLQLFEKYKDDLRPHLTEAFNYNAQQIERASKNLRRLKSEIKALKEKIQAIGQPPYKFSYQAA